MIALTESGIGRQSFQMYMTLREKYLNCADEIMIAAIIPQIPPKPVDLRDADIQLFFALTTELKWGEAAVSLTPKLNMLIFFY